MVADNDIVGFAFSIDQDANLPVDLCGDLRQAPSKFMSQHPVGRDFPSVEQLYFVNLRGPEPGQVAVYFFNGCPRA
jgi:hypothetical protein